MYYSLKDIIIKKVLILAYKYSSDLNYKDILNNIKTIIFLKVSHKDFDNT